MKKTINNIFLLNNFNSVEIGEHILYASCNNDIKYYWMVLECSPSHLMSAQEDLIELCINKINDPALEKNINILCLWEIENFNDDIKKSIQEVEEDPYFFKKHILYFTRKELNEIKEKIESESLSDLLDKQVSSPFVFETYKNEYNNETWESLLYRIVIKASFIQIKKKESGRISDLETNIANKINSRKDSDILESIKKIITNNAFENNLDPLDTLEKIQIKLKENGHEL